MPAKNMNDLVSLCRRRGFVFGGSEIYGGMQGLYDYGPNGVELLRNIKNAWWSSMIYQRDDIDGIDAALISSRLLWKYSGHEGGFSDPLVVCKKCGHRMREDNMKDPTKCENCGASDLTPPRDYQLMMALSVGAVAEGEVNAYLRPETATTTYTNFRNVMDATPKKLPFGLAQIGKAFRNEIAPRNFVFRTREFEQAEMQYFINPKDDAKWFDEWKMSRLEWWKSALGIPEKSLRFKPHEKLAHYAKAAVDIEYSFPDGFEEVEGVHNRQDFDLGSHTKGQDEFDIQAEVLENTDSVAKLNYVDPQTGDNFIPFVIETAMGVNRAMMAVLHNAYAEEKLENGETRIVLKMKPSLSPIKAAVIPLARNVPELVALAEQVEKDLRALSIGRVVIENSGNIGKNYRRHDEIGTPVCVTIDHRSLEDGMATLRDRDTMAQTRVKIEDIPAAVAAAIRG